MTEYRVVITDVTPGAVQYLHEHRWTTPDDPGQVAYLNGCGGTGEGNQSASSFVLHSWTGGLQQVVDAADEPGTLRWVSVANLTYRTGWGGME